MTAEQIANWEAEKIRILGLVIFSDEPFTAEELASLEAAKIKFLGVEFLQ